MNADGWVRIIAAVAALVAAGLVLKFVFKFRQTNITKVKQKGNKVGGDNAGRDINK